MPLFSYAIQMKSTPVIQFGYNQSAFQAPLKPLSASGLKQINPLTAAPIALPELCLQVCLDERQQFSFRLFYRDLQSPGSLHATWLFSPEYLETIWDQTNIELPFSSQLLLFVWIHRAKICPALISTVVIPWLTNQGLSEMDANFLIARLSGNLDQMIAALPEELESQLWKFIQTELTPPAGQPHVLPEVWETAFYQLQSTPEQRLWFPGQAPENNALDLSRMLPASYFVEDHNGLYAGPLITLQELLEYLLNRNSQLANLLPGGSQAILCMNLSLGALLLNLHGHGFEPFLNAATAMLRLHNGHSHRDLPWNLIHPPIATKKTVEMPVMVGFELPEDKE